MSDDPETVSPPKDDSEVDDRGGDVEVHDTPLGAPADLDPEDAPLPGIPEGEPPFGG